MKKLTDEEKAIIARALHAHSGELSKLMKKAEKLGIKEAGDLKMYLLEVESLRHKVGGAVEPIDDQDESEDEPG